MRDCPRWISLIRPVARPWARVALAVLAGLIVWSVLPAAFGWRSSVVISGSMYPAIAPGDVVVSDPDAVDQIVRGNIVLVRAPGEPRRTLVHRVVERRADGDLTLRGDANQTNDSSVINSTQVLGVVRLRIGSVGLPALWWHEGRYGHLVAATATLLVLLSAAQRTSTGRHDEGAGDPDSTTSPTEQLVAA